MNRMEKLKFEQIKKTWDSGLLLNTDEVDFLIAQLSTALSLSSAYREALVAVKEHLEICAEPRRCPEIRAALESALNRGQEEPVGREE